MEDLQPRKSSSWKWISAVLVIVIIMVLFKYGFVTVPAGHRGIHHRAGKIIKTLDPGLHFQIPFVDKIVPFDVRSRCIDKKIECFSSEMMDVTLDITLLYDVNPDIVEYVYKKYGTNDDISSNLVRPMLEHTVTSIISNQKIRGIHLERDELSKNIEDELMDKARKMFIWDSSNGGATFSLLGVYDPDGIKTNPNIEPQPVFIGSRKVDGYKIQSYGDYRKIYTYHSIINVCTVDIRNVDYSEEFKRELTKIQMAEQKRKAENEKEVTP